MPQIIPVTNYPDQRFRIVLDAVPINMRVYWSNFDQWVIDLTGIDGQWYCDMSDETGVIVINGFALVNGCDMLAPYAFDQLGGLWVFNAEGKSTDLDFDSLGDTQQLIYVPVAEKEQFDRDIGWAA